jgi:glycosyltransferase involved in cell wall biosynthesis
MHIGIDARLTHYRMGGISTYIRNLVREYARWQDPEYQFTVFHSRKASDTVAPTLHRANLWTPCHHRIERTALSFELVRFGLDVYHATDFILPHYAARRHVISVHDLAFLHYPQFMTDESRRYYNDQIQRAVDQADHILTISESTKRDIIDMLNVSPDKITVHTLGTSSIFKPQTQEHIVQAKQALNLPDPYILFVGTFEPRKNIPGLLEAYRLLVDQIPNAPHLVLAGNKGWLFDETMQKIEAMALRDRIHWREGVPQQWLPGLYAGAIVHLMPSFYEGFGLPALEAMACGTVPVVSGVSSLPEVVGDVGVQVDPTDAQSIADGIAHVVIDDDWRHQQETQAVQRAATFTWEKAAQIALDVYERVARN